MVKPLTNMLLLLLGRLEEQDAGLLWSWLRQGVSETPFYIGRAVVASAERIWFHGCR